MAAIGGLWASAVATYWSQQTARDQLQQSRDDAEKDERAQAVAVSAWYEGIDSQWTVHVLNRSPDPVPALKVTFSGRVVFEKFNGYLPKGKWERAWLTVETSRLAPCTELIYSPRQISHTWTRYPEERVERPTFQVFLSGIDSTEFTDREGRNWWRDRTELKRGSPPWRPAPQWENGTIDDPVVKEAASCGRDE
ncbi:hypothetical protein [Streptomyces sp. NPDC055056]